MVTTIRPNIPPGMASTSSAYFGSRRRLQSGQYNARHESTTSLDPSLSKLMRPPVNPKVTPRRLGAFGLAPTRSPLVQHMIATVT